MFPIILTDVRWYCLFGPKLWQYNYQKIVHANRKFFWLFVYRLGFDKSRQAARQLVNHGHFLVNGKKVNIPSYQVKTGQEITLRSQSKASKVFENLGASLAKKELLPWLSVNAETLVGKVNAYPNMADTQVNFDFKKIIEFYSR